MPRTNIGIVGHVDHGKTTLTKALTKKWTDTHSEEMKRGITIRLGYADMDIYKYPKKPKYSIEEKIGGQKGQYVRTVSIVDAPGHETLMTTVLSGSALMDGALLVIAANEKCPQPQTREHLTALDIVGIRNIIVVQNKIDLVSQNEALDNYKQIKNFLKGSVAENAPIIPVSAQHDVNIDHLLETIEQTIPDPTRDAKKPAKMFIARSFDINKPGIQISKIQGGVLGGSLVEGELSVGDVVEIRPGFKLDNKYQPISTKIVDIQQAGVSMDKTLPGGLLGVSTELDPFLTKSDELSGNVLGTPGKLPPVMERMSFKTNLLERVVGSKEELNVDPIKMNDVLLITVGITRTVGSVVSAKKDQAEVVLKIPVCADKGDKITISRQVAGRWRLIGWGEIN
ncbi:MAG: translation initiation factor IF-2 subunit gamma [Candidatus Aenigmatarchaeota archaeon]